VCACKRYHPSRESCFFKLPPPFRFPFAPAIAHCPLSERVPRTGANAPPPSARLAGPHAPACAPGRGANDGGQRASAVWGCRGRSPLQRRSEAHETSEQNVLNWNGCTEFGRCLNELDRSMGFLAPPWKCHAKAPYWISNFYSRTDSHSSGFPGTAGWSDKDDPPPWGEDRQMVSGRAGRGVRQTEGGRACSRWSACNAFLFLVLAFIHSCLSWPVIWRWTRGQLLRRQK